MWPRTVNCDGSSKEFFFPKNKINERVILWMERIHWSILLEWNNHNFNNRSDSIIQKNKINNNIDQIRLLGWQSRVRVG